MNSSGSPAPIQSTSATPSALERHRGKLGGGAGATGLALVLAERYLAMLEKAAGDAACQQSLQAMTDLLAKTIGQ